MLSTFFIIASWAALLIEIDRKIALAAQRAGCPWCRGRLDAGHYRRKVFGCELDEGSRLGVRWSWCCRRKGCRRRLTPPSVLFWGRLQFVAPLVLALLGEDPNSSAGQEMRFRIDCARSTWRRWRERWAGMWENSVGRMLAGMALLSEAVRGSVPAVLSLWSGSWPHQVAMLLLAIHPMTGGPSWERAHQPHGSLDPQSMGFAGELASLKDEPRSF